MRCKGSTIPSIQAIPPKHFQPLLRHPKVLVSLSPRNDLSTMHKFLVLLLGLSASFWIFSCTTEEDFTTDSNATLEFSVDTLRFDTVFTEIGSATRYFKVYNRNDRSIRISKISLLGSSRVAFRMNVDGVPGKELTDVEIRANDSIYVFAEVTIDPNQPLSVSPFVVEDRILFETNGNLQDVLLEAWGQNANYFPSRFFKGVPVVLGCNNQTITWNDPKPYVIYGEVFVDSCTINIPAGTRIYVHGGIARNELFGTFNDGILYMLPNGRIRMMGTKENPVIIQGDRLESSFQDDPGQWAGIVVGKGSKGNVFQHAIIKNSIYGIYADSASDVRLLNTQIFNTSSSGIIGVHSRLTAENCLIYNNQSTSLVLAYGGDYNFTYCTIASYGVNAAALSATNYFCYDDPLTCRVRGDYRMNANFRNCIFFGSQKDQIRLGDVSGGSPSSMFNVKFLNCVVKVEGLLTEQNSRFAKFFETYCSDCINGKATDRLFINPSEDNYRLDSLSIALDKGKPITDPTAVLFDLEGNNRHPSTPDPGCFEKN